MEKSLNTPREWSRASTVPVDQSDAIESGLAESSLHPNKVKRALARNIVESYYDEAAAVAAEEAFDKVTAAETLVCGLQDKMSGDKRRADNSAALLRLLCERVAVCSRDVMEALDITMPTVNSLIESFVEAGILEETTGQKKNRVHLFRRLCDVFGG